jgi:hypothetical protein
MIDEDKLNEYIIYFKRNDCRLGQSCMNALYEVDKDLYNEITGTEADCFYDDAKIPSFIEKVFAERGQV